MRKYGLLLKTSSRRALNIKKERTFGGSNLIGKTSSQFLKKANCQVTVKPSNLSFLRQWIDLGIPAHSAIG